MSCKILMSDGTKSVLGAKLQDALGSEKLATELISKFKGEDFKQNVFGGDWEALKSKEQLDIFDEEMLSRTEPNGEPKLHKKEGTNQYYILDKNANKWFINKTKFPDMFPHESEEVSSFLLHQFVSNGGALSLNELEGYEKKNGIISASIEKSIQYYRDRIKSFNDPEITADYMPIADLMESYKEDFRLDLINKIESLGKKVSSSETEIDGRINIIDSIQNNRKDAATANMKIFLSQLEDIDLDGKVAIGDYLGMESFVPVDQVWEILKPLLADTVASGTGSDLNDIFDVMLDKITNFEEVKGWAKSLVIKLRDFDNKKNGEMLKSEFVQAFSSTKLNMYVTETSKGNRYKIFNATDVNNKENTILRSWGFLFQQRFVEGGKISPTNMTRLISNLSGSRKLFTEWKSGLEDIRNKTKDESERELLIDELNIDITDRYIEILNEIGIGTNQGFDVEDLDTYLHLNDIEKTNSSIEKLFESVDRMLTSVTKKDAKFFSDSKFINPFETESTFKKLAVALNMKDLTGAEFSVLANQGKTYYPFSNNTYLSNKINSWKADKSELIKLSTMTSNKNSRWIKYLLGTEISGRSEAEQNKLSEERIEKFKTGIASSFTSKGKNDGVDNIDININDQINDNISKMLGGKIKRKSYFPTIVAADKSRRMEFEGLPFFDSGIFLEDGKISIGSASIELMLGYFTDEYNRMAEVADEIATLDENDLIEHYHLGAMNGLKSQIFPGFSHNSTDERYSTVRAILYKDGKPITNSSLSGLSDNQKKILRDAIKADLTDRVQETIDKLSKLPGKDKDILNAYGNNIEKRTAAMSGDYLMNGLISSIEYSKMFSGDPSYYKTIEDMIKRIPGTYSDGLSLRLSGKDQITFSQATIENVQLASRHVAMIRKSLDDASIADAYANVDTTDAQAWITPARWKFLKEALGQWGKRHDKVYKKMQAGTPLSKGERKLSAQPLKGVYFDLVDGRPVYLKYSQAVLMPQLVKGTPLEGLLDKMIEQGVDEVVTASGIKVGSKKPTKIHDGNNIMSEITLNATNLPNAGWKLQQDLPVKTTHSAVVGSQIQKNILEGLQLDEIYSNGETGAQLNTKIHSLVSKLSDLGRESLSEKFGIVDGKIKDKSKLYSAMIEELKSRGKGGNENVISALEKELPFDAIPQIRKKVESIFFSMVNKALIKIETNGGSFIQMSPFGLESISDESGIIVVSKNYSKKDGLLPPRVVKGKVLPGQALMPMSDVLDLLRKADIDYSDKSHKEIADMLDPAILNIVSYRIPNQGMSSNDALEIVGILPEGSGDKIITYDGMPAKTGSDFDIDKLFIMSHNLVFNEKTQMVEKLTEENKEFTTNAEAKLIQNELVDAYLTVLTSKVNYDTMMTSIDGGLLKEDVNSLFPAPKMSNMQMFSPLQQLKTKHEYVSGKFGVAQTANQLTDHIYSQTYKISLDAYIGIGHTIKKLNKKGNIVNRTLFDGKRSKGETTASILSQFLTAYVDVAKDPFISRGNHNAITANVTFMMLRAGVDMKFVNRFIGQPILFELVELMQDSEGITSERLEIEGSSAKAIDVLKERLLAEPSREKGNTILNRLTSSRMEKSIKDGIRDADFDMDILTAFEYLSQKSKSFSESVLASKSDTKGSGGSVSDMILFSNKINKVIQDNHIVGFDSKFKGTMLGTYKNNTLNWMSDVLNQSDMFLLSGDDIYITYDSVSRAAGKGDLMVSTDLMEAANKALYSYVVSKFSLFKNNRGSINQLFKSLPIEVAKIQENGTDNFFINQLEISDLGTGNFKFISLNGAEKSLDYQNNMSRSWLALYNDPSTKTLAKNLVKYTFAQSGFQNNISQFFTHIPHEILKEEGFSEFIKDKNNIGLLDDKRYVDQMMRNNAENTKLVPRISNKNIVQIGKVSSEAGFEISEDKLDNFGYIDQYEEYAYPRFVTLSVKHFDPVSQFETEDVRLYELAGQTEGKERDIPTYVRVNKLGYKQGKNSITEYDANIDISNSVISTNNVVSSLQSGINAIKNSVGIYTDDVGTLLTNNKIEDMDMSKAMEEGALTLEEFKAGVSAVIKDENIEEKCN